VLLLLALQQHLLQWSGLQWLLLLRLLLRLVLLAPQQHLLQWYGLQWLVVLLLLCARVSASSVHAPLSVLGSLLCTPPSLERSGHQQQFISPDPGKIHLYRSLNCLLCITRPDIPALVLKGALVPLERDVSSRGKIFPHLMGCAGRWKSGISRPHQQSPLLQCKAVLHAWICHA
jgi:hypothetical protein